MHKSPGRQPPLQRLHDPSTRFRLTHHLRLLTGPSAFPGELKSQPRICRLAERRLAVSRGHLAGGKRWGRAMLRRRAGTSSRICRCAANRDDSTRITGGVGLLGGRCYSRGRPQTPPCPAKSPLARAMSDEPSRLDRTRSPHSRRSRGSFHLISFPPGAKDVI